jgi:Ca2+-transporting ATPase
VILELCSRQREGGAERELTPALREEILAHNGDMARSALRVLAVAYRPLAELPAQVTPQELEQDLVFVGLLGMIDPPRPEVVQR